MIDNETDDDLAEPLGLDAATSLSHTKDSALEDAFQAWRTSPTPENTGVVVRRLQPTIDYTLGKLGVGEDRVVRTKARTVVANSLKKYDPEKNVPLPAYVGRQLQALSRAAREQASPIKMPDRFTLEQHRVGQSTEELSRVLGREPTLHELQDHTGFSLKKLKQLRNAPRITAEGFFERGLDDESGASEIDHSSPDYLEEALDYVYFDLTPREKRIMEHLTGYGGAKTKTPAEISDMLEISQSQVSRIKARIALQIQEILRQLERGR